MNLTVAEAAKILNKSPEFVREGIESGALPIGSCVMLNRKNFHINKEALDTYLKYGNRPLIIETKEE